MTGRKVGGHDIIFLECTSIEAEILATGLRTLQEEHSGDLPCPFVNKHMKLIKSMGSVCQELSEVPVEKSSLEETS